jgi:hypothetical protein
MVLEKDILMYGKKQECNKSVISKLEYIKKDNVRSFPMKNKRNGSMGKCSKDV